MTIDLAEASRSDKLKHTISYETVVNIASEAFCARRYRLVEAAAGAVADAVLDRCPQVRFVRVTVHKPHAPIAATFDDVGVTIERARDDRADRAEAQGKKNPMAEAFIALGGNMGDVRKTFERAIAMLCDGAIVRLMARSSDYRTPPWGVTDQPAFVNAVIAVTTSLSPHELLRARRKLRTRAGARPRAGTPLGTARDRHRPPRL